MKNFLLAIFLCCAVAAQAQTAPATPIAASYRYCVLLVDDRLFSSPDRVQLDYGQSAPGAVADPEMAEMAKNVRASHSVVDVLNYLSRHGWELVDVTTVQTGGRKSSIDPNISYADSETRYLLRRRMP